MRKKQTAKLLKPYLKTLRRGKKNPKRPKRKKLPIQSIYEEPQGYSKKAKRIGKKAKRKAKAQETRRKLQARYEANQERKNQQRLDRTITGYFDNKNARILQELLKRRKLEYVGYNRIMQELYNFILDETMNRPNTIGTRWNYENILLENDFHPDILTNFMGENVFLEVLDLFVDHLIETEMAVPIEIE